MRNRTKYALAAAGCLFVFAWVLAAPALQLPIGATVATGGSMGTETPQFQLWADTEPAVGDIVVFDAHGTAYDAYTSHRVVDETDRGYITKGDANSIPDQELESVEPVTDETLVGTVLVSITLNQAFYAVSTLATICMFSTVATLRTSERPV